MGRTPEKPWFWTARKSWVVQWGGRRIVLAKGKSAKAEAFARFNQMMAEAGKPAAEADASPTVDDLVLWYLQDLKGRRERGEIDAQTKADSERRLAGFAEMYIGLPADQMREHHVDSWLATKADWGKTSRHDGVGAVKTVFRWAKRKGRIDINPLADIPKPKRVKRREAMPSAEIAAKALGAVLNPQLGELLAYIEDTGCRPKEARTLEARHLDLANGVAVLDEHKTAHKTGKPRILYLTEKAAEIAGRLAAIRPAGPIFLNTKGNPWTGNALVQAMESLRDRAGLGPEVIAYGLRHLFATTGLANGLSDTMMAELMGHADTRMMGVYGHLGDNRDVVRAALSKARGKSGGE